MRAEGPKGQFFVVLSADLEVVLSRGLKRVGTRQEGVLQGFAARR